jgi:hypothetical protein
MQGGPKVVRLPQSDSDPSAVTFFASDRCSSFYEIILETPLHAALCECARECARGASQPVTTLLWGARSEIRYHGYEPRGLGVYSTDRNSRQRDR